MGEEESGKSDSLEKPSILYFAEFSQEFNYYYTEVFSGEKLDLIDDFLDHYEANGLKGWKGKVSGSWNVPIHYPDWESRAKYAREHNLWHAHIGLPYWQSYPNVPFKTSNQVLHFQKINRFEIKLLTLSTHNPMDLPSIENILDEE